MEVIDGRHYQSNVGVKANQRRTPLSTPVTIYALSDPRNKTLVRYIGKTSKPLHRRLCEHVAERNRPKRNHRREWIKKLHSEGVTPKIWPIEVCAKENWIEREMHWIWLFKPVGLTNGTDGGEGGEGNAGWKWKPEALAKISEIRKGKKLSPENAEMRRRQLTEKARPLAATPEALLKRSLKLRGRKVSRESIEKANATKRRRRALGEIKSLVWTPEMRLAASLKQIGISKPSKTKQKVVCIETGEVFESLKAAGTRTGFGGGKISVAIARQKTSGGFHWRKL